MIRIYKLNDCDWWAGASLEACIAAARLQCGEDASIDDDAREVTDLEMLTLYRTVLDPDERPMGRQTFAQALAEDLAIRGDDPAPFIFASTEW